MLKYAICTSRGVYAETCYIEGATLQSATLHLEGATLKSATCTSRGGYAEICYMYI